MLNTYQVVDAIMQDVLGPMVLTAVWLGFNLVNIVYLWKIKKD